MFENFLYQFDKSTNKCRLIKTINKSNSTDIIIMSIKISKYANNQIFSLNVFDVRLFKEPQKNHSQSIPRRTSIYQSTCFLPLDNFIITIHYQMSTNESATLTSPRNFVLLLTIPFALFICCFGSPPLHNTTLGYFSSLFVLKRDTGTNYNLNLKTNFTREY